MRNIAAGCFPSTTGSEQGVDALRSTAMLPTLLLATRDKHRADRTGVEIRRQPSECAEGTRLPV